MTITIEDENGDELEFDLPMKWEICGDCRGNGSHVHRAIDGHGIGMEEFAEDPEFAEAYYSGRYDVCCETCGGSGKVQIVDEDAVKRLGLESVLEEWEALQADAAADAAADRYTRWMEGGGYG